MSTDTVTPATGDTNVDAEVRFVEEGHHTWLRHDAEGWHCLIHSDTERDKTYRVTVIAHRGAGRPVFTRCQPQGGGLVDDHGDTHRSNGRACCKHAAGVLRRLERDADLVRFVASFVDLESSRASGGSCWLATDKLADDVRAQHLIAELAGHPPAAPPAPADPFAGFPR